MGYEGGVSTPVWIRFFVNLGERTLAVPGQCRMVGAPRCRSAGGTSAVEDYVFSVCIDLGQQTREVRR